MEVHTDVLQNGLNSNIFLSELIEEEQKEKVVIENEINNVVNFEYSSLKSNFKSLLKYPRPLDKPSPVFSIRFEKQDNILASSYQNGYIVIYNVETQDHLRFFQYSDSPVTSIRWKPYSGDKAKNILLSVGSDGNIVHWHTLTGKVLHVLNDNGNPIMCLDYNSEGSYFATAGNDKTVKIWDESMKVLHTTMKGCSLSRPGHSNRIFSVCFDKTNSNFLASAGWDNTIQFYDVKSGCVVNSIYGPHISGDSIDIKNNLLLTGSYDLRNQIQLWDLRTYKLLETINWNEEKKERGPFIYTAQFSKSYKNNLIGVGSSNFNSYRVFDMDSKNLPLASSKTLAKPCYAIDFSHNGNYFCYGTGDGNIRILSIEIK